jgi:hypothetical protein
MLEMLRAHGLNAGPTQRPILAGAIAGLLADAVVLPLLRGFGGIDAIAGGVHSGVVPVMLMHAAVMSAAGAGYGLLFQRAANDPYGGWLFGMAYGFLIWMVVAVPILQWLPEKPVMIGLPGLGLYIVHVLWGLLVGLGFRYVHRPLQDRFGTNTLVAWLEGASWR